MTLLKLLATALAALSFMIVALPGYAANDGDGVANRRRMALRPPRPSRGITATTSIGVTASGIIAGCRTRTRGLHLPAR